MGAAGSFSSWAAVWNFHDFEGALFLGPPFLPCAPDLLRSLHDPPGRRHPALQWLIGALDEAHERGDDLELLLLFQHTQQDDETSFVAELSECGGRESEDAAFNGALQ